MADVDFIWVADNASSGVVTSSGGLGKSFTLTHGISMTKAKAQSEQRGYDLRCGRIVARIKGQSAASESFPTLPDVQKGLEKWSDFKVRCGGGNPQICINVTKYEKQATMVGALMSSFTTLLNGAMGGGTPTPWAPPAQGNLATDLKPAVNAYQKTMSALGAAFAGFNDVPVCFWISCEASDDATKATIASPLVNFGQILQAMQAQNVTAKGSMDGQNLIGSLGDLAGIASDQVGPALLG